MRTDCFHTHAIERLMGMEYLRVKTFQTGSTYPYVGGNCKLLFFIQVFTSLSSGDTMNMDRIQVLGNSFLKLTISIYAHKYSRNSTTSSRHAILHQLRESFMGKDNLVSSSIKNQLCHRIKVCL